MRGNEPGLEFTVGESPAVPRAVYHRILARFGREPWPSPGLDRDSVSLMRRSRLMLVASGTATLQGALLETPLVIVYRVSPLNYFLARRLVKIPDIGLVNVILGERVAPELIQADATPAAVAAAARRLLEDGGTRETMLARFRGLRGMLAGGRGCERVAEMATELMER
jgi:lipid-A-disaccharide synthase